MFFSPLVLIVAGTSLAYYLSEEQQLIQSLKQQEKHYQEIQTDTLSHEFQLIVSDMVVLSSHEQLRLIVNDSGAANHSALAKEFLAFCRNKKMYDQVRYLDATGMEIVRVNFNSGKTVVVPAEQLQSKRGRYYFEDTFRLEPGEVFVSPFDLNIEGGAIERPFKPTIRFGIPVFNNRGEKRGIIVLNYLGEQLIDHLEKYNHNAIVPGFDMLMNSDGYFLKGMRSEDEWGFMLPDRKDRTFSNLFPAQWDKVSGAPSGQFLDDEGLFTFTTVYPLAEGLQSSSGSPEALGSSISKLNANQYSWKITSFTPHASIMGLTRELREGLFLLNVLLGLLGGAAIWFLARDIAKRRVLENEIEHMAHFDLLTGLPNRPLLYDRMGIALKNAQRNKQILAVFFLDLDGFKDVNDSLGHKAGDQVLIEVAHRLEQCVRGSDTVARLGGDEFVLVLSSTTGPEALETIATKITSALSEPIMVNDQPCSIGASIGIAICPKDGETPDSLISKADAAMYTAKQSGKNTWRFSA